MKTMLTGLVLTGLLALSLSTSASAAQPVRSPIDIPSHGHFHGPRGPRTAGPDALVAQWYQRFLHREPDPGAGCWVKDLSQGESPDCVLAKILGSEEYYCKAGHCAPEFVNHLYRDVTGRPAPECEVRTWAERIQHGTPREALARDLLRAYPSTVGRPMMYR